MILDKHLRAKGGLQQQYQVEKIVDERKDGNRMLFLVKWVGYPHEENTWEPRNHLLKAPEKIREWNTNKKKNIAKQKTQFSYAVGTKFVGNHSRIMKKMRPGSCTVETNVAKNQEKITDAAQSGQQHAKSVRIEREVQCRAMTRQRHLKSRNNNFHEQICKSSITKSTNDLCLLKNQEQKVDMQTRSQLKKDQSNNKPKFNKKQTEVSIITSQQITVGEIESTKEVVVIQPTNMSEEKPVSDNGEDPQEYDFDEKQQDRFIIQEEKFQDAQLQSLQPIPHMEGYLASNHSSFFEESVQLTLMVDRQPYLYTLTEITKMFKHQGIVYCTVITKQGTEVDRVPYQTLEAERPDIVLDFFNNKYPCG